jgi:hypothetical protein
MSRIRTLLAKSGLSERRKDQRMDAQGLSVSYTAGSQQKSVRIGNISPTGLYLATEERWAPGTPILLTLGEKSVFQSFSRSQVKLFAKCVRVDENGVGLAFAHAHVDRAKWLEAMSKAPLMIAENHPVHVFRYTRALAFLFHISPASEGQILKLMTETFSRERTERAVEIALMAADILESESRTSRTDLAPNFVRQILELAVEADEEEARGYWARLLAVCSLADSQDDLNLALLNSLAQLNIFHLRILTAAWSLTGEAEPKTSPASSDAVVCTVEEIQAIAGISNEESLESTVHDLHEFGLLGSSAKPAFGARLAKVNLSLTELGLNFCDRCCFEPEPVIEPSQTIDYYEPYIPVDIDYAFSASSGKEMSYSLASEAQTMRQTGNLALAD